MIHEAMEFIHDLAIGSQRAVVVPELSSSQELALQADGSITRHDKPLPPRFHKVETFESLGQSLQLFASEGDTSIWLQRNQIVVVLDQHEHRVNRIHMPLVQHGGFEILQSASWIDQKQMLDLLRHDLSDCEVTPESLSESVSSLKFTRKSEDTGKFTNTSAAMGKSVEAEATGEVQLPDTVMVSFHPYPALHETLPVDVCITCTLFTDPLEGLLKLAPRPGEIDHAFSRALEAVQTAVHEEDSRFPILLGTP